MDPIILQSQLDQARRELAEARVSLALTRSQAMHWEYECKDLRRQIQRMRMDCDTERLPKPNDLHDLPSNP